MKILTIIVSYNFEKWIERCLGSLKTSSHPTDIIVIDNCSNDRTVEIIKTQYTHVRLIENHANLGFGKANNIGMQLALQEGYDAVFLLNQDAWIGSDTLATLAEQSVKHPEFGILSPVHLNGSGEELDKGFASYAQLASINNLPHRHEPISCPFINAAFWFIPVSTLQRTGGFSPLFYHYGEDKDYVNRLHFHQYKIGYIPTVYGCHDREFRKVSFEGFLRAERVYLLSEYTNINYHFTQAFAYGILAGIKKLTIALLKGNIKYAKGYAIYADGASDTYNVQHHHGAAFESELVAYRIYFNEKQTTDLYGKFHKGLELEESQFYPTGEQLKRGFGDDVIKVNSSCGAGTLRGWDGTQSTLIKPVAVRGQRILASGPVRTIVDAEVKGWQYQNKELNMINRYTLYAGHRDAQVDVLFDAPLDKEVFCTGVQNITGHADMFSDHNGLVASWGTDWPVNDTVKYKKETVGLATYIPKKYVVKETSDKENFLYTISAPGKSSFRYYTSFTSCKETFGYPDKEKWFAYVQEWKKALEQPVKITVVKK